MAEIQNPQIKQFYQEAQAFIQTTKAGKKADPCFAIRPGMDEWAAWGMYLTQRCGSLPAAMRETERRKVDTYTVPAQWPEWFDAGYPAPERLYFRSSLRPDPTPDERAKTIASMERYKRNPPGPILGDPSWALLDRKGGRKLIGWHRAGEALQKYTGRSKPTAEAAE